MNVDDLESEVVFDPVSRQKLLNILFAKEELFSLLNYLCKIKDDPCYWLKEVRKIIGENRRQV